MKSKPGLDMMYPPNRSAEDSDWLREAIPYNMFIPLCNNILVPIAEQQNQELHEGLRARGFLVGWGEEMGRGRIGHVGLVYTKLGGFCKSFLLKFYDYELELCIQVSMWVVLSA